MSRYKASGVQGEFEPGSNNTVLANKLGITSSEDMDDVELELLQKLYHHIFNEEFSVETITLEVIKTWHRQWFGNVYDWAGEERSVNMSKGGFSFAVASQVPKLLAQFEKEVLNKHTPCNSLTLETLAKSIAVAHVEFVLIHPFREGNGRIARLLADVMAVQAGCGLLDYSSWEADKDSYILAIQQGLNMNYKPMESFVKKALGIN